MTSFRPTPAAAVLGLCIALGPTLAGYFIYKGILEAKVADRYVTTKGLVERVEKADRGLWTIAFKVSGNELGPLYEKMTQNTEAIKAFVLQNGFKAEEITNSVPQVTDLHAQSYNSGPLAPERYLIEGSVSIESKNVDQIKKVSEKTGDLIRQGITLSRSNVDYYLDKFNDLRPVLIAEATKNAFEVAEGFAKTTGSKVEGIRRANQGVIQLTSPNASPNESWDVGASSLMKKIRVVSTLEFYIK